MGPEPRWEGCSGQRGQGAHSWAQDMWGDTCPSQLDLAPGAGAAYGTLAEGPLLREFRLLWLWEPLLSAALSPLHVRGCGFSSTDLLALQLPVEVDGRLTRGPSPKSSRTATCSHGQPLPLLWTSPGGREVPCPVHCPPVQEREPDPRAPARHSPRFPASPSRALPPFLHCLPRSWQGCASLPQTPCVPPPTCHNPLHSPFLLPARAQADPQAHTDLSEWAKVGRRPCALMPAGAARATPVQPASEAAFQACRGTQLSWGAPMMC